MKIAEGLFFTLGLMIQSGLWLWTLVVMWLVPPQQEGYETKWWAEWETLQS